MNDVTLSNILAVLDRQNQLLIDICNAIYEIKAEQIKKDSPASNEVLEAVL